MEGIVRIFKKGLALSPIFLIWGEFGRSYDQKISKRVCLCF